MQTSNLILQIGDSILLMLESFLQGTELRLDCLCLFILQRNDLAAVVDDLLLMHVESGLDPLEDIKEMIVLVSKLTLVNGQLLVDLPVCFLHSLHLVLGDLWIINNARPNITDSGQ